MKFVVSLLTVVVLCCKVAASETPDECPPRPRDDQVAVEIARAWFKKGQDHIISKKYSLAVDAFLCSSEMVPHPSTFYNAGKAALLAKRYDVALEMGHRILTVADDEQQKKEARELLEEVQKRRAAKEGAQESEPETESDSETDRVVFPPVTVQESLETSDEQSQVVEVGDEKEIHQEPSVLWKSGLTVSLVGGATLVAGGILQGLAGFAEKTTGEPGDYQKYKAAKEDVGIYQTAAIVSFVAGGAALITGITLVIIDKKKRSHPRVSLMPTGQGVLVEGTF